MHHKRTDLTVTIPPPSSIDCSLPEIESAQDIPLPPSPCDDWHWHKEDCELITVVRSTIPSTIYLANLVDSPAPITSRDTTAAVDRVGRIEYYWSDTSSSQNSPPPRNEISLSEHDPFSILSYYHTGIRSPVAPSTQPMRISDESAVLDCISAYRAGFSPEASLPDPLLNPSFVLKGARSTFGYLTGALLLAVTVATTFYMSLLIDSGVYYSGDPNRSSESITDVTSENEEIGSEPVAENTPEHSDEENTDWEDVGSVWEFESHHDDDDDEDDDWVTNYSDSVGD